MRIGLGRTARLRAGYTLIELLVVGAIIALMASLIFPVMSTVRKKRAMALAQSELKQVETAIEAYKSKLGFYPPDNAARGNDWYQTVNPLYFELKGTVLTEDGRFMTMDGSASISTSSLPVLFENPQFSGGGFANSSASEQSSDEEKAAIDFLGAGLKPSQVGQMIVGNDRMNAVLACSVLWPASDPPAVRWNPDPPPAPFSPAPVPVTQRLNPWRYISSAPTNNPGTYDLWVDVVIGKRIYRVSNWSEQPEVVGTWPPLP